MSEYVYVREQQLKKKREYYRRWRANNPDKVQAANAKYWATPFVQYCEDYSLQERATANTGDKWLRKKGEGGMQQIKGYQDNP